MNWVFEISSRHAQRIKHTLLIAALVVAALCLASAYWRQFDRLAELNKTWIRVAALAENSNEVQSMLRDKKKESLSYFLMAENGEALRNNLTTELQSLIQAIGKTEVSVTFREAIESEPRERLYAQVELKAAPEECRQTIAQLEKMSPPVFIDKFVLKNQIELGEQSETRLLCTIHLHGEILSTEPESKP